MMVSRAVAVTLRSGQMFFLESGTAFAKMIVCNRKSIQGYLRAGERIIGNLSTKVHAVNATAEDLAAVADDAVNGRAIRFVSIDEGRRLLTDAGHSTGKTVEEAEQMSFDDPHSSGAVITDAASGDLLAWYSSVRLAGEALFTNENSAEMVSNANTRQDGLIRGQHSRYGQDRLRARRFKDLSMEEQEKVLAA